MIPAFILVAASVHACTLFLPQILASYGRSADTAALATSAVGTEVLAGRIGTGFFLDRYFGPRVASFVFVSSAAGIGLLLSTGNGPFPAVVGACLTGLGFGAETDIIAYLMGRYFGLRSLGTALGFGVGALILAGGFGPLVMGFAFDRTGSYRLPLTIFLISTLLAAAMAASLGPYKFGTKADASARPVPTFEGALL